MNSQMSTDRSMAKSAGVLAGMTLVSRVLGFARDILIANFFGTKLVAEAFVVSYKLPNLFRDLVGEGAMNAAIVPVLTKTRTVDGREEFYKLTQALAFWFIGALLLVTILGVIFAPLVIRIIAPGFIDDPDKYDLTILLSRMLFPFIFLIGVSAFMMGFLNSLKSFAVSALGPILLNICMILALVIAVPVWGIKALIIGILIGGALQCIVQIPSIFRSGFKPVKGIIFHPGVKRVLQLLGPRLWGTAIYQTSVFVDTILASFAWIVGAGGQSALYYASRLFQLPLSIFGVSLAQAALPTLSGQYAEKQYESFRTSVEFALKNVIFTTLPASLGLMVFSREIVEILLKRGAFGNYSVDITSNALFYYSVGLVSCGIIKILVSAFYALQDTKTPVKTATTCLFINIGLNLVFMWKLQVGGLALATSLAATANAFFLICILGKRIGTFWTNSLKASLLKTVVSSTIMVLFCYLVLKPVLNSVALEQSILISVTFLISFIVLGVLIYYTTSLILRSEEAKSLKQLLLRLKKS